MNAQSDAYSQVLTTFASEGARIINLDRTTRYPTIGRRGTRPLEPGFIPVDGPPRLVTVSFYPNHTEPETDDFRKARQSFFVWAALGDVASYEAAYRDWLEALPTFPFHRDFDRPIFDALDIGDDRFAWLPLVKAPLPARTAVHEDDVFIDRMLLWDQLALLKPRVILAQGMEKRRVVREA